MKIWKLALLAGTATAALIVALALTGLAHGWALLAYILFLASLAFMWLLSRLRAVLPPCRDFERLVARREVRPATVDQFETVRGWVAIARYTQADVYLRLRPLVREIVAARLLRAHGIDLYHEPQRAGAVVGPGRTWELVRPDSPPPEDRLARGWSQRELEQLVEELERL